MPYGNHSPLALAISYIGRYNIFYKITALDYEGFYRVFDSHKSIVYTTWEEGSGTQIKKKAAPRVSKFLTHSEVVT